MKTAISMPDELFTRAENFAKRHRLTRSALVSKAVEEYLRKRQSDEITTQLNALYATVDSSLDPAFARMQYEVLRKEDTWWDAGKFGGPTSPNRLVRNRRSSGRC